MLAPFLVEAFDRLDDFVAVQDAAGGITVEAVELLQEAAGVRDEERVVIRERLAELQPGAHPGAVLLGVLIGLLSRSA